jgi:hypothetical protein
MPSLASANANQRHSQSQLPRRCHSQHRLSTPALTMVTGSFTRSSRPTLCVGRAGAGCLIKSAGYLGHRHCSFTRCRLSLRAGNVCTQWQFLWRPTRCIVHSSIQLARRLVALRCGGSPSVGFSRRRSSRELHIARSCDRREPLWGRLAEGVKYGCCPTARCT